NGPLLPAKRHPDRCRDTLVPPALRGDVLDSAVDPHVDETARLQDAERSGGADDGRELVFPGDDGGVAEAATDLSDQARESREERHPGRIGEACHQDFALTDGVDFLRVTNDTDAPHDVLFTRDAGATQHVTGLADGPPDRSDLDPLEVP